MTSLPIPASSIDHVLVASPNSFVRERILEGLKSRVRHIEQVRGGAEALLQLENGNWQKLFLDKRLLDLNVEELTQTVQRRFPQIEIVLVDHETNGQSGEDESLAAPSSHSSDSETTGYARHASGEDASCEDGSCEDAICEDASSEDTPCEKDDAARGSLRRDEMPLSESIELEATLPGMIGRSAKMMAVYRTVHLVAGRDTTVLITGPTGSGKELVARALHDLSARAANSFVVVNCAAIPEALLESELFGYSRGAFTGAQQSYAGRIQAAHTGTLFLDEIGDMPLSLQPKLLRFLEHKEMQRLGSAQTVRVDVRIVAATNLDLVKAVNEGRFREDLYYRLSTFPLSIPPLSERAEDIAELASHFLREFSVASPSPLLSSDAVRMLQTRNWRGNVRELQNVMERSLIVARGEPVIRPVHLGLEQAEIAPFCAHHQTPSPVRGMRVF
ncbi:MAG: sigma-54 dependent transcriptional regulator [Terriglobales bacterium]